MPRLIRLYIRQVLIGFALSAAFVGALMWFDVARLWSLVSHSDVGPLAVFLLWLFNGIVFAGVQFGIAIMRMADTGDGSGGKRRPVVRPEAVRVAAEAKAPRRTALRRDRPL